MILCDTNVFIHAFNGNKNELTQMKKKLRYYDIVHVDKLISNTAIDLIATFKLSHALQIPDAIIGATAIVYNIPLYTYNIRDFNFMPNINIHTV